MRLRGVRIAGGGLRVRGWRLRVEGSGSSRAGVGEVAVGHAVLVPPSTADSVADSC